jgi:DNA-binding MarR family transcriptional regulator
LTRHVDINIIERVSTVPKTNLVNLQNFEPVPFTTTLLVRDTCLCLYVQRAARALARRFDEALKPAGINNGQFSLLMSLNRPSMPGVPPATMSSVAQLLGMDRTTLTAAVKTLAARGLLEVHPDTGDRRVRHLRLTPAGMEVLVQAVPIWTATHAEVEAALASPDQLRTALNQLSGQPSAPCAPTPSADI